jgi:anti-anti-sigma regulatory factor
MTEAVKTERVAAGDHACLTFTDPEERLDLVAAFVRDGLRSGHKVVCWTDSLTPDDLAHQLAARSVRPGAALKRGQLRIEPTSDERMGGVTLTAAGMIEVLTAEVKATQRQGYQGLRVTADMGWATRPSVAADELITFEHAVAELFTDTQLCLVCQYDRDRFDAVTLAFAARTHPKTVAARVYYEDAILRICRQYSPPGIRMAGQLDYRHRDEVEQALGESLRLDRHMHVNLADLEYIDGACAGAIVATAARLPASRRMTVTCRRAVATVLSLAGASDVPQLRVGIVS